MLQYDVIVFPVIDWSFRLQRPQQIAIELARRGHRVFYLKTVFTEAALPRPYLFWASPIENVYVVQMRCPSPHPNIYKDLLDDHQISALIDGFDQLRRSCGLRNLVSIIDLPFWRSVAMGLQGNLTVYDCMDYHAGFLNNEKLMLDEEDHLIQEADVVVTSSASLSELVGHRRENVLIRNACDVDHFLARHDLPVQRLSSRPVVGYFGAIDHWYDIDLVEAAARAYRQWDFVLIGRTHGCNISSAAKQPNIQFLGEVPYELLPQYLHGFDVCMIPFQLNELTIHTNPVKLYEYLAAGKPVVGTAMPEIMIGGEGLVYVGQDRADFIAKLGTAMAERNNPTFVESRIAYAKNQTWSARVDRFEAVMSRFYPKVTVIVLTYNNLDLTKKCLHSIEAESDYPDLELIIVDNDSSDGTQEWLRAFADSRPDVKLILNDRNLGFSGGNNCGMRAATGDYLVLLNNDTQVTRGWIFDLLRHMRRDPQLGLVGAVTNNIGNEAKVDLQYIDGTDFHAPARRYVQRRRGERLITSTVAFFCAMLSRAAYRAVGDLDEIFAVGMFEDDDYCRRVEAAGFRIAIADDVFVHHELSASLNELGAARRQELFEANKRLYEAKWGPWIPHRYRDQPQTKAAMRPS